MQKVRINQGRIVPFGFRIVGTLFIFLGVTAAMLNLGQFSAITISIVLGMMMPFIWSSYYILEINPEKKTITEASWILSWKQAKDTKYEYLEKIFVNETRKQQRMTSWGGKVRTSKFKELVAFIKLSTGEKFYLLSASDTKEMNKKLSPIQSKLQCEVVYNC